VKHNRGLLEVEELDHDISLVNVKGRWEDSRYNACIGDNEYASQAVGLDTGDHFTFLPQMVSHLSLFTMPGIPGEYSNENCCVMRIQIHRPVLNNYVDTNILETF
jgi:hypothetical protein